MALAVYNADFVSKRKKIIRFGKTLGCEKMSLRLCVLPVHTKHPAVFAVAQNRKNCVIYISKLQSRSTQLKKKNIYNYFQAALRIALM